MLELWSGILSNNAAKVRIVLAEKQVPYKTHELPWTKQRQWDPKPEAFLAVSPRGQVPVLIDDGFVIHDSTVINEYLEDKFPLPALLPADLTDRTEARIWEDEGDYYQGPVGVLISDVFLGDPDAGLTDAAADAIKSLEHFFERLDNQLEGRKYIARSYSVADISVFLTVMFATTLGAQAQGDNLQRWLETMLARPVVKAEYDAILNGVAAL